MNSVKKIVRLRYPIYKNHENEMDITYWLNLDNLIQLIIN